LNFHKFVIITDGY